MAFEPFEAPFSHVKGLGCRDLLWGERLVLDLFEYLQSGPAEEVKVAGETIPDAYPIGLTKSSRIWRLTFERPFALRVRDQLLRFHQSKNAHLPSPYCFAEKSDWLSELISEPIVDPSLGDLTPTHYIFALWDDYVEIVANGSPIIEEIENDLV